MQKIQEGVNNVECKKNLIKKAHVCFEKLYSFQAKLTIKYDLK